MTTPRQLKTYLELGKNISALLREEHNIHLNTEEIIDISYDLTSGSYIAKMDNPVHAQYKESSGQELSKTIHSLCDPVTILEAGVGECTTFVFCAAKFG